MKNPCVWLVAAVLSLSCDAAQIAYEPFDYPEDSALSTQAGGVGWRAAWFHDGESAVTDANGLNYADWLGNVLIVSGFGANTAGTATTRSMRDFAAESLNDVWISFLYQLSTSNNKFEGVSFYRNGQQLFSVSNPSTTTTANIVLTNNVNGSASDSQKGSFGLTHLIVLNLTKGGGVGGVDRIDLFVDPLLAGNPSAPAATISGANFDFDRVRIAGQDGASLWVDELRVGDTFADVTPHSSAPDQDSDGDGLTDAQEAVLGLDPYSSDAKLIVGLAAHPDWLGLYTSTQILALGNGGVVWPKTGDDSLDFTFGVQQSEDLNEWEMLESFHRQIDLPPGKNFLRVILQDQ